MLILVSDANILIDMEEGGLLVSMFSLDCKLIIPEILYEEELAERHSNLLDMGLEPMPLKPETLIRVLDLVQVYRRPSRNDLFALALAAQERCSLLTGDKHLRKAAEQERVAVYGTIWLVEKLVRDGKISTDTAQAAYESMLRSGSRLPWRVAKDRLKKGD